MRLNFKKVIAAGGAVVVFWLIMSYSSMIEVPRSVATRDSYVEMEERIDRLQKEVDSQYGEMTGLLQKVHKHLKVKPSNEERQEEKQENESGQDLRQVLPAPPKATVLPVLVIACDRVTVKRCLDNLVKMRPNKTTFPIIVSQDCGHNATYQVIKSFTDLDPTIAVVRQPDLSEIVIPRHKVKFRGYYKIARHFKFALNHVFQTLGHEAVIIVEDDLDISPDFFEYFLGTYPLLQQDPSIWCISAWNDNGKKDVIDRSRPELLHRTDFFPGLGWLLRRESWLQLEPNWPPAFFDDWLRDPVNTHSRSCIRPEISRTYSFGKIGVSKGLFFDMHLRHMQLNMEYVEFTKLNLTYLLKENYDEWFISSVYAAQAMSADEVASLPRGGGGGAGGGAGGGGGEPVRVTYRDARSFQKAAKKLGLMDDFRSGIPRTAYLGVVTCYVHGRRVYLAPGFSWTRYDPAWA